MTSTQHPRLTLVSATEVIIRRNDCGFDTVFNIRGGSLFENHLSTDNYPKRSSEEKRWDTAGEEARALISTCWRQTNDFAALDDGSAVQFAGKKVRHGGDCVVTILHTYKNGGCRVLFDDDSIADISADDFQALAPTPQYRAFANAVEFVNASDELRRCIRSQFSTTPIIYVKQCGVLSGTELGGGTYRTWEQLLDCVWSDSDLPCGVPVTTSERK